MPDPLFLGIETGGTKLQVGLGHGDGRILALRRVDIVPGDGAAGILAQIGAAIGPMLDDFGAPRDRIAAVGVGFGGPVDAARGVVTTSHQVAGWDGFPLGDWVRDRLNVSVVSVHNDADTAALGEARFGAGVGLSPIVYVTIGSGIGGGLVMDGTIYRGAGAGAMEIGHLWIGTQAMPPAFPEGRFARLEDIASGWSIGRAARRVVARQLAGGSHPTLMTDLVDRDPDRVTAKVVAEAAGRGDRQAIQILDMAARVFSYGLSHVVTLLHPRRIVLGGGVTLIDRQFWLIPVQEQLDEHVFPPFRGTYDVVPAALGEEVVVHGALALARDAWGATR